VNIDTLEPETAEHLQMNDIAVIELETSSPLFFDAYENNRTTGSFIVIDPLTNATLAAGMILSDLPENGQIPTGRPTPDSQSPVTPLERHRRHGHQPAIILVNARAALARKLERALFDDGFEAIVVDENPATPSARNLWKTLHSAGFVVIYHNPSLGPEERMALQSAACDNFFDLSDPELPAGDAEAVEHILASVARLRIGPRSEKLGRVN